MPTSAKKIQDRPELHESIEHITEQDSANLTNKHQVKSEEFWLIEIWKERREVFKALVEHVIGFTLLIGSLIFFHYLIKITDLPPDHKELLDKIDFYGIVLALGTFSISFIYKLVSDAFATAKRKKQAERLLILRMKKILMEATEISEEETNEFISRQIEKMRRLAK